MKQEQKERQEQFEQQLENLKDKYPVGSVVKIKHEEHEEPPRFSDLEELPETYKARVTGHEIHTQTFVNDNPERNLYPEEELGARVCVSTNPPERFGGKVENTNLDFVTGKRAKPEHIVEKVKEWEI